MTLQLWTLATRSCPFMPIVKEEVGVLCENYENNWMSISFSSDKRPLQIVHLLSKLVTPVNQVRLYYRGAMPQIHMCLEVLCPEWSHATIGPMPYVPKSVEGVQ
ncbi:hypothetical protein VNO77_31406 [Canavalia gladiata]|uniref:Uncharacterized protein n=1 Tax=Canavalia gladiata TaxID=3824 RepID=A0AAN9KSM9_CANGL